MSENQIILNTKNYPVGLMLIEIKTKSEKFIEKMIKNLFINKLYLENTNLINIISNDNILKINYSIFNKI